MSSSSSLALSRTVYVLPPSAASLRLRQVFHPGGEELGSFYRVSPKVKWSELGGDLGALKQMLGVMGLC